MAALLTLRLDAYARRVGWFVRQEALSCVFAFGVFFCLGASKIVHVPGIDRYDLLFVLCIGLQGLMIKLKLETFDELKAVFVFHAIGLAMEIYKVQMGSWGYPEPGLLKIANVPLYSGFMYASVGSYVCQAWRRMDLKIEGWPPAWQAVSIAGAIYANFFTSHVLIDVRWVLVLGALYVFRHTWVDYRLADIRARMPLGLSFFLIGSCIWLAENAATRLGAWKYPHQEEGWEMVQTEKIGSWGLLIIVTVVVVAQLKRVKSAQRPAASRGT